MNEQVDSPMPEQNLRPEDIKLSLDEEKVYKPIRLKYDKGTKLTEQENFIMIRLEWLGYARSSLAACRALLEDAKPMVEQVEECDLSERIAAQLAGVGEE